MDWSKATYEKTVARTCFWYTPYDEGWDAASELGFDMGGDDELRQIVEMELDVRTISQWAKLLVGGAFRWLPPCGHYFFPRAYVEAVEAVGKGRAPEFIHGCYAVDRMRKERMQDYVFCLDAWLKGAAHDDASRELSKRGSGKVNWDEACAALWDTLGEMTEAKSIRVERIVHRQRWWIKSMVWDDDARDVFGRDTYLGDIDCDGDTYGNARFADPYFAERDAPAVKRLRERAHALSPDVDFDWGNVEESWLCAPKAFRYLERELWSVGRGRSTEEGEGGEEVPDFLQCRDTCPDPRQARAWWAEFTSALESWWRREKAPDTDVARQMYRRLGGATDEKIWLVRLLRYRIELLVRNTDEGLHKLTAGRRGGWCGTRRVR